jgi:hypothetical protein
MQETNRIGEEANRMGREAQEQAQRMGHEFQKAAVDGFETAGRSLSEVNRGFQAIAAEMTTYSKKAFDDAIRTWEQLIGVRSVEQAVQIQSDYAKKAYENHMAERINFGGLPTHPRLRCGLRAWTQSPAPTLRSRHTHLTSKPRKPR